jgi:hypothetical protein
MSRVFSVWGILSGGYDGEGHAQARGDCGSGLRAKRMVIAENSQALGRAPKPSHVRPNQPEFARSSTPRRVCDCVADKTTPTGKRVEAVDSFLCGDTEYWSAQSSQFLLPGSRIIRHLTPGTCSYPLASRSPQMYMEVVTQR